MTKPCQGGDGSKTVKIEQADRSPSQGIHGILRPVNQHVLHPQQKQHQQEWNSGRHLSQFRPSIPSGEDSAPAIDPSLTSDYPDTNGHSLYGNGISSFPVAERPQTYTLPSLEQIATEVLDMDGTGGEVPESGLAAIEEYNRLKDADSHVSSHTKDVQEDAVQIEGSVDSGVHLAAGTSPTADRSDSPDTPAERVAHEDSHPEEATSLEPRRNSLVNVPLYRPPNMAVKSPELVKILPNGADTTGSNKRRRESLSSASASSPAGKKPRPAVDTTEDAKLAQPLQPEDIGLRRGLERSEP